MQRNMMLKSNFPALFLSALLSSVEGFSSVSIGSPIQSTRSSALKLVPEPSFLDTTLQVADKDYSEVIKSALIVLTLGGGLIPATISANSAMFDTLSGKNRAEDVDADANAQDSFDPTIKEKKYRAYVQASGATGPELAFSTLLFTADRIPVADIVAILGRIQSVNSIADWDNLPSTRLPNVSETNPPKWLPRRAFKVNVRKAKFSGWPIDSKTGEPVGGQALKDAELARVSKKDALISDAALDAVFDTWAWGASIATPDKVARTLVGYKKADGSVDLGGFIGSAIGGRSATLFAALTFVVIQIVAYGTLFVVPAVRFFSE